MHLLDVLVVDHEPGLARRYTRSLQRGGYSVAAAFDVASAMSLIAQCSPLMVVTDYQVGARSGLDLTIAVGERWPLVPLVLIGGDMDHDLSAGARTLRIRACFHKPIPRALLLAVVRDVIGPPPN